MVSPVDVGRASFLNLCKAMVIPRRNVSRNVNRVERILSSLYFHLNYSAIAVMASKASALEADTTYLNLKLWTQKSRLTY
jgi:hypothetical protein